MNVIVTRIWFFIFLFPLSAIGNQTLLSGYIISQKNKMPLSGCSIFNYSQNIGTLSDRNGFFTIPATASDEVQIRFLGYEMYEVDSSEFGDTIIIELKVKVRELKAVSIRSPFNARNSVLYNPEYDKKKLQQNEVRVIHRLEEYTGLGTFLTSPITALYYSFSPKAQRKLWAIEKLEKKRIADLRYNNDFIALILNTTDEEVILNARRHCNFDEDFILTSTFYELGAALNGCYRNYMIKNETGGNRISAQPEIETDEY